MTVFKISPDKSVFTSVAHAFDDDDGGPDSLVVDTGAYLAALGAAAFGAFLANTGAWTVTINGSVYSDLEAGIVLGSGNTGVSTITVGATGEVGGANRGILLGSSGNIKNAGVISAWETGSSGIQFSGGGQHSVTNSGTISGDGYAILDFSGTSNDTVTNSGLILDDVDLGDGTNKVVNSHFMVGALLDRKSVV